MAYKYTQGKVFRGDIYNEDDTQKNTYLDWSEDALGVVVGGTTNFVVSSSTVGIGTASPTHEFEVYPDTDVTAEIGRAFVGHNGFNDGAATFGHRDLQGSAYALYQNAAGMTILNTGVSEPIYFRIDNSNKAILDSSGQFGIGTTTPNSTFQVSGSQAGNLLTVGDANATLDETHHIVQFTDATGGQKCMLPAANTCGGRTYHIFNQTGGEEGGTISVNPAEGSGDTIDGNESIDLDSSEGNMSISVVSNGSDRWMIFGQYSQHEEGG